MEASTWVLISGAGAAALGFALLGFAHWAMLKVWGCEPHLLVRYVTGCSIILALLGAWCLVQPEPVPAWWAWLAAAGITCGAGLGTAVGHGLDEWDGMRKERAMRNGQQRAAADGDL